jgi:hypothetical protein
MHAVAHVVIFMVVFDVTITPGRLVVWIASRIVGPTTTGRGIFVISFLY